MPANQRGRVDLAALKAKLGPDVAAVMLTNPNTCGLFETEIREIADAVHDAGAYFYCDGANFNAIVGRVRPGDLGVDVMHINLHKTFSTPHGGGGPGAGPVVLSASLAPFAPLPWIVHGKNGLTLLEQSEGEASHAFGRLKGFHGQMGMFVRALAYMMSHGGDGLRQVASDAVLNANYLLASLKDTLSAPFAGPCMHEALFDDRFLKDSGVTTLDIAKALIDEGFHPMTVYFPLVVHGALLIEPTETESKATLDRFIAVLKALTAEAKAGNAEKFHQAPVLTPRRRFDETAARARRCCDTGRRCRSNGRRNSGLYGFFGGVAEAVLPKCRTAFIIRMKAGSRRILCRPRCVRSPSGGRRGHHRDRGILPPAQQ